MSTKLKLNQALAEEALQRTRRDEGHKWFTAGIRSMVMDGARKVYTPNDEDGEQLPPDEKIVQDTGPAVLRQLVDYYIPYMDAVATKDFGNVEARADVILDGKTVLAGAPVPHLLFVEKMLGEWRGYINAMPQRDRAKRWERQEGDIWETDAVTQNRSIKAQLPVEVSPATKEHKAQVMVMEKANFVGTYQTVHTSGAYSQEEKETLLHRIDALLGAVRRAREQANTTEIDTRDIAQCLFNNIFK